MFVVAIATLASSVEDEVAALAEQIHASLYDLRLRLTGAFPAVVLTTTNQTEAVSVLHGIRQRGHGALMCDLRQVVPGTSMMAMRHFVFEEQVVRADRGSLHILPYDRILALIHAAHHELHQIIGHELVYKGPRSGMARKETITGEHDAPQSLYIFRNDGETPWILREREAHYGGLGAARGPAQHQNFLFAIRALRARAPHAHFDDRLTARPRSPDHFLRSFGRPDPVTPAWADHSGDLAAHLIAQWFAQNAGGPYR